MALVLALVGAVALLPAGIPLGIAGIGVVSGCLLALHAMGIVLLYSRTRVLSFAQFGLGAAAAVLFFLWVQYNQWAVLAEGVCRCLAPDGSGLGDLQHAPDAFREHLLATAPWVVVANALISAGLGVLLAADTGRQVFLWLAFLFGRGPRIMPTIATLAFSVLLGGAAGLITLRTEEVLGWRPFSWLPYGPRPGTGIEGRQPLPEGTFEAPYADVVAIRLAGGARFQLYDLLAVLLTVLALAYLVGRFERGRRGLASRATAADLERAATLGVDVIQESKGPWKVAGALSGLSGVLAVCLASTAPEMDLDMYALTLVLAAVVLARMTSPTWALVASVLLGVLSQGMFWNFGSTVHFQGTLVLVIGAALLMQRGRLSRAELASESVFTTAAEVPPVRAGLRTVPGVHGLLRGSALVVVGALVGYPLISSPGQLSLGVVIVAFMVLGLSLLVISGWAGQVSLGQLALAAAGAWVVTLAGGEWGVPMPLALVLGAIAGGLISPAVGFPALRLPGPFVVIMTLALALAVPAVLLNADLLGDVLPATLARPVLLGLDLGSDRYFYWFSLLVLAATVGAVTGLRRSRMRRALIAARDNAQAAAAFGIDVTRLRLEAFVVSGLIAGLGGGLLAYANGGVQAETFSATNSVVLFLIVVIGGLGSVSGPLLGAAAYGLVQLGGTFWLHLLNGIGTIVVLALRPTGLSGLVLGLRDAAVRVILHLQGHDQVRLSQSRVPIADRGAQAPVVPVRYRLVGSGYGPVEGTRLRAVEGVEGTATADVAALAAQVDEAMEGAVPLLSCHRLDVAYGGATAVSGITLSLAPGEVLAVIGLNGAGKTSLLRALVGLEPAAHGTVEIRGEDVTRVFPQDRAAKGLAYVPGGSAVLATLTVRENLVVAGGDEGAIADVVVRFPALAERLDTAAGNLSGGEQQVLSVAQACLRRPCVLLIDELSLGLSPEALAAVLAVVEELAAAGTAVVLVEQSISTAMAIADTALFLESGRVRYQGPAQALREQPELFSSIAFGAGAVAATGSGSELARAQLDLAGEREPVLVVEGLCAAYGDVPVVADVSLEVAPGEVVGVLGPNGAGKTSLFDALSGSLGVAAGTVTLAGEDVTGLAPHARAARGLMRSFQSVRLFPSLTVRDCVAVALETRLTVKSAALAALWLPPARAEERRVDERVRVLLELLRLESVADTPVGSLSLGTRRMVDLACQLAARPKVLLLDEPASGLAAAETELLGPLVGRISSDLGCAVLIIEHNVQVLASVAHRLVAMQAGRVVSQGPPSAVLADPVVRAAYFGAAPAADPALVAT